MTPPPSNRDDPVLLEAFLNDAQKTYANLLALIEHSLQADPETEASQAMAFQAQIAELMAESRVRLDALNDAIRPWDERRGRFPPDLAARVDRFFELLETGLKGLQSQVSHRLAGIEERRAELRQAIEKLSEQRRGVQGYRQKDPRSKRLRHKA
jgi:hypothetical protein